MRGAQPRKGTKALDDFARLIAQTALEAMPLDLLVTSEIQEGMSALREAWPDIVDAFLFRGGRREAASAGT